MSGAILEEITRHVDFNPDFDAGLLMYNPELGFAVSTEEDVALQGLIKVFGFATPLNSDGTYNINRFAWPIVDFNDLPPSQQTIDAQGKGVGTRLYSSPRSLLGARKLAPEIGAYTVTMRDESIKDLRPEQGGKLAQIARHAGRIAQSRRTSVREVVESIHESYDGAAAVELMVPPHPRLRRFLRGPSQPDTAVPENFIILRQRRLILHKAGVVDPTRLAF